MAAAREVAAYISDPLGLRRSGLGFQSLRLLSTKILMVYEDWSGVVALKDQGLERSLEFRTQSTDQ